MPPELAITLPAASAPGPCPEKPPPQEKHPFQDQAESWLTVVRRFADQLALTPGRRGPALTRLAEELGAAGACLLAVDENRGEAKMLRVLQEKRLRPLGGAPVELDFRLVTAIKADLEALMSDGGFRRDLYFRIAGCVVRLPTLAERPGDLPALIGGILIGGILEETVRELGKPIRGLTVGALERLAGRAWPGNVRQLEHEGRRLVGRCPEGGVVDSSMVSEDLRAISEPAIPDTGPGGPPRPPGLPVTWTGNLRPNSNAHASPERA